MAVFFCAMNWPLAQGETCLRPTGWQASPTPSATESRYRKMNGFAFSYSTADATNPLARNKSLCFIALWSKSSVIGDKWSWAATGSCL